MPFSSFYWYTFEALKPKYAKFFQAAANRSGMMDTHGGFMSVHNDHESQIDRNNNINSSTNSDRNKVDEEVHGIVSFASAATAGMMASLLTHPFDVLKTRQQLSEFRVSTGNNNRISEIDISSKITKVKNNIDISVLYKEGGIKALYKGIHLRMATVVPAGAIMITVYEAVKSMKL